MRSRQRGFVLLCLSACAGSGCIRRAGDDPAAPARQPGGLSRVTVEVAKASRAELAATIELVGNFLPYRRTVLVSEVDGVIAEVPDRVVQMQGKTFRLPLDIGAEVKKGELLVRLDDSDFQLQKRVAAANLERARKDFEKLIAGTRPEEIRRLEGAVREAEARRDHALADLRRAEQLIRTSAIARSELDRFQAQARMAEAALEQAQAALDAARAGPTEAEVAVAKAAIAQAQSQLDRAQWRIDHARIYAPYDGVITDRYVDEGDRVTALPRVEIMELMDVRLLSAEVAVPERYLRCVHAGEPAAITVRGMTEPVEGTVVRINEKVDAATRTFRVRIGVENAARRFRVGQFVRVALRVATVPNALTVPAKAVTYVGGQPHVFVVVAGRAQRRRVELGIENPQRVEVLAGLEEGERVVVEDPSVLADGMRVRLKGPTVARRR